LVRYSVNGGLTRGQYIYIYIYIYTHTYTLKSLDEIPTRKIVPKVELLNSKHKIAYIVKTISVHV